MLGLIFTLKKKGNCGAVNAQAAVAAALPGAGSSQVTYSVFTPSGKSAQNLAPCP